MIMTHKLRRFVHHKCLAQLAQNDTSAIADTMYAITSGLKVLVEETSVEDVEVARRSMGGHGYTVAPSLAYAAPSMSAISQVQRKWSLDVRASRISRLIRAGMRAITFVLHQQVVRAAPSLKSYKSHIRSKCQTQTRPSKISTPVQCIHTCASYTHRSHSAAAPDASESSPSGLDEPSLAKLSTFWNGGERESSKHMLPSMQRGEIDAKAGL